MRLWGLITSNLCWNLCCFLSGLLTTATLWLCCTCSSSCFLLTTLWSCLLCSFLATLWSSFLSSLLSGLLAALWSCLLCSGLLTALWCCLLCGALACFLLGCSHVFLLSAGSDPSPDLLPRMVPYIGKKFQHLDKVFVSCRTRIFSLIRALFATPRYRAFGHVLLAHGVHKDRFDCRTCGTLARRVRSQRPLRYRVDRHRQSHPAAQ